MECAAKMPKFTSVVRAIQQERDFGVEPQTVEAIAVPMELQATKGYEFCGSCTRAGDSDRLFLFTTEANLDILARALHSLGR